MNWVLSISIMGVGVGKVRFELTGAPHDGTAAHRVMEFYVVLGENRINHKPLINY